LLEPTSENETHQGSTTIEHHAIDVGIKPPNSGFGMFWQQTWGAEMKISTSYRISVELDLNCVLRHQTTRFTVIRNKG
jgi:hypothetical protein